MRKMFCAELILYDIYQKSLFSADVKVTPENLQAQSKNLRSIKPVDALAIARIHLDSTRQAIEQRDAMLAELMKTRRSTSSFGGKRGSGVHIPPWNAPSNTPRRYS